MGTHRRAAIVAALACTLAGVSITAQAAPQDTLRTIAAQKLKSRGLAQWERRWYEQIAAGKASPRRVIVWQTQYGKHNGYGGDLYHLAANPRYLPLGTVVYLPSTGRLHVVTNRGADSNDRIARGKHASFWCDVWTERLGQYGWQSKTGSMWIVGRAPWPGAKKR